MNKTQATSTRCGASDSVEPVICDRLQEGGTEHVPKESNLDDGEVLKFELKTHLPPAVYKGGGYDSGFIDERGLGLHRGVIEEHDVYDVSHAEDVVLEDGRVIRPWHREATCTLTVNGESGLGHFPIISTGEIKRYGLTGAIVNAKS